MPVLRYLLLMVLCTLGVIALTAGVIVVLTFLEAGSLDSATGDRIARSALGFSVASGLHVGAIGAMAWWIARADGVPTGQCPREVLALHEPTARGLGAATLVGLGTPALAAWVASLVQSISHLDPRHGDEIARAMTEGPIPARILLVLIVVIGAPLGEELAFRGGFWFRAGTRGRDVRAFCVTSVLFALWHVDPLQIAGVLTTAFALGALRLMGGSVSLTIAAHAVHNGIATAMLRADPGEELLPIWILGLGAILVAAGLRIARDEAPPPGRPISIRKGAAEGEEPLAEPTEQG